MNRSYWEQRKQWYAEMAAHLKEQKDHADNQEKQRLAKELERIYNEIGFIQDNHLA